MVKIRFRGKEYEVKSGMNLHSALKKLHILPETVLALRDGEVIPEDELLRDGDEIRLVAVISGG